MSVEFEKQVRVVLSDESEVVLRTVQDEYEGTSYELDFGSGEWVVSLSEDDRVDLLEALNLISDEDN
jgi:hypothetical protein